MASKSGSGEGKKEVTLVLVGKTGNGKSSTGNTILKEGAGPQPFSTAVGFSSHTTKLEMEKCTRQDGVILTVINTPDLHIMSKGEAEEEQEVDNWLRHVKGLPWVVVLVIRADCRYTREEFQVYQLHKKILERKVKKSRYSITENLLLVFTMGDALNGRDLRVDLEDHASSELKKVLKDASHRYVVFDNMASSQDKQATVNAFLQVVENMKPHPFPQQLCRLLLEGDEKSQFSIADILCPCAGDQPSKFFRFHRPAGRQSLDHRFAGLKLEVALTPSGMEKDKEVQESVLRSVSPGPHAVIFVTTPELILSAELQELEKRYPVHYLIVIWVETPLDKITLPKNIKRNKVLILDRTTRAKQEDIKQQLLTKVEDLVTTNEGSLFRNQEMNDLAEQLQDTLHEKAEVTYGEYLQLKSEESKSHIDSRLK